MQNLNLQLRQGERIALIGENGEGKTTIVKLVTRLYDPTQGGIFLDGVDLRDYDLEDYASQIAVIFQDFMRYDMSALRYCDRTNQREVTIFQGFNLRRERALRTL